MNGSIQCGYGAGANPIQEFPHLPIPAAEPRTENWYAAYTCSRSEKCVAKQLNERRVECFLPLYGSWRRWKDRRKLLELALFPGYVFVRIALQERLRVLEVPHVVRLVSFNGQPAPLPEQDIESLRQGLQHGVCAEPHRYLRLGRKVRVVHGPMAGTHGILVRKKDSLRVVVSLDLLMRSVAVEVDAADVEAV